MTFIKLTDTRGGEAWVRASAITTIGAYGGHTMVNSCAVKESPAEILALLAEPVAVTEAMVRAAYEAFRTAPGDWCQAMRPALEAALAVRAP